MTTAHPTLQPTTGPLPATRDAIRAKLFLLALLYVSQAVPLGFFTVALPAILRQQGVGLERIGLVGVLAVPWLFKFLWAPLVDRFGSRRHGHFRSWILPLQMLSALAVAGLAMVDPSARLPVVFALGGLFMLLAATQDVATDGLAVHSLRFEERGPANGLQVGGYYLGLILGGGGVLLVFDRLGWRAALLGMAAVLALPLIPAWRFREPARRASASDAPPSGFRALGRFFRRRGFAGWLGLVLIFRAGETAALAMFNPMLVDLGRTLEEIGVLLGMVNAAAALAGAVLGGQLIRRLGRRRSLAIFSATVALAVASMILPASGADGGWVLFAAAAALAFAGGLATAALYTNMMDACREHSAATDFSFQQSMAAVGPIVGSALSGVVAARIGYAGFFLAVALFSVGVALLAARTRVPSAQRIAEDRT